MPRFYFHIDAPGAALFVDDEGVELPNLNDVQAQTAIVVAEMLADGSLAGIDLSSSNIIVVDETGQTLLVIPVLSG